MVVLGFLSFLFADPAPGLTRSKAKARTYECERVTADAALKERPGSLRESRPRGDYVERGALICTQRVMPEGSRAPRDEAVLSTLEAESTEVAAAVASLRPDLAERTWMVEPFYPSPEVSTKLAFAAKTALMRQGLQVSDRLPTLAVGDVDVLTRMAPSDAYPAACRRYAEIGSLGEEHALLAVVSRDSRETILHAGVCADGHWMWLR